MKFYISYFYALRFMKPEAVPLSTGHSDPPYFHDNRNRYYVFRDKRGVMNGLRAEPFVPHCEYSDHFMEDYKKQLDALDFDEMMERFESIAERVSPGVEDPEVVLLVWEAPDNPISERWPLFEWFQEHGVKVEEYPIPAKKPAKPKRQEVYNF